uniref:Uncharacterized protein n=1 Tax=Eutreptiella gymnastica TaxID=73025 RepID=A0A7S4CIR3_9EUGL
MLPLPAEATYRATAECKHFPSLNACHRRGGEGSRAEDLFSPLNRHTSPLDCTHTYRSSSPRDPAVPGAAGGDLQQVKSLGKMVGRVLVSPDGHAIIFGMTT